MTNARFEDLEKRVKKIKLKKSLKIWTILIVLISIGYYLFSSYVVYFEQQQKPLHVESMQTKKEPKKSQKVESLKPVERVKATPKKIEKSINKKLEYDTLKLSSSVELPFEKKIEKQQKPQKSPVVLKINLHVKEVKSEDVLLERFRVAEDFESAIGLANLYFSKKSFEKSIYWSKKASKLSSGDESAWLIYAKSKYAIGRTDDAIKALRLYLEYFSSDEIERLLEQYRSKK